jgi:hypothetical protein
MKKVLLLFILLNIFTSGNSAEYSYRLPDKAWILNVLGFPNGVFDKNEDLVSSLSFACDMAFLAVDGNREVLDTEEEFITANYYSPPESTSEEIKEKLDKELPPNEEGALRLIAMWMKKKVEDRNNSENYNKVIGAIKARASLNKEETVKDYYGKAITKEINKFGKIVFGAKYTEKELTETILKTVIKYYMLPSMDNYKSMTAEGMRLVKTDRSGILSEGFFKVLSFMNEGLCSRVKTSIDRQLEEEANK